MFGRYTQKGFQDTRWKQFPNTSLKTQLRVVGGSPSFPGQLPWQIEIVHKYDPDWVCGGTLISPTKIVRCQKLTKFDKTWQKFLIPGKWQQLIVSGKSKLGLSTNQIHFSVVIRSKPVILIEMICQLIQMIPLTLEDLHYPLYKYATSNKLRNIRNSQEFTLF